MSSAFQKSLLITRNNTMSVIPKIIHHIAPKDKSKWHIFWHSCYESWKTNFPEYKFVLWNDKEDIDDFVKTYYPQYLNLYSSFQADIMRIDFVRLCILHKYGGIYADMDIYCYKNFEHLMSKDIYFLENLTNEFTNAQFENSMMASIPNHKILEEMMKYCKVCFIQFRGMFRKENNNWRSIENDKIVNNTTGSGMISEAIKFFGNFVDIGKFECALFNNRPMSYDPSFYTKHMHTSIWGNEFINDELDRLMLINGSAYLIGKKEVSYAEKNGYQIVMNKDFCFFKDYTSGIYLKEDNLVQIREMVQPK